MSTGIRVAPVSTSRERSEFIAFPKRLHASDPHWVAPLDRDLRQLLTPGKHPFHAEGRVEPLLAVCDGEVVGRIASIRNPAHERHWNEAVHFFGFFECVRDESVARALLAEVSARAEGRQVLRGPFSPSTNYECGVLVEGRPGRPTLMMPHNPPWYGELLEAAGLSKCMDLLAWEFLNEGVDLARWQRISALIKKREGVHLRPFEMKAFAREVELVQRIYHDAWRDNWGFVPMSPSELRAMAVELKPIIRPELGAFVMKGDEAVAFQLALPDYNEVLQKLEGRLFPTGFLRLLLAKNKLRHMRVMLMGVVQTERHKGLDVLLYADIAEKALRYDMKSTEASWILETNDAMNNTITRGGGQLTRRYRIYEKALSV